MTPMSQPTPPLPLVDEESRAYWDGARRHELVILRCARCRFYVHYPRARCPRCDSGDLAPSPVSGRGVVHSYTVTHHRGAPGFENAVPFAVALIELDEQPGLRIVANLLGCEPAAVRIGMPVEVVFQDVAPDVTLPQFRVRSPDAAP
jgi:uncharacterized OB-fold protein